MSKLIVHQRFSSPFATCHRPHTSFTSQEPRLQESNAVWKPSRTNQRVESLFVEALGVDFKTKTTTCPKPHLSQQIGPWHSARLINKKLFSSGSRRLVSKLKHVVTTPSCLKPKRHCFGFSFGKRTATLHTGHLLEP